MRYNPACAQAGLAASIGRGFNLTYKGNAESVPRSGKRWNAGDPVNPGLCVLPDSIKNSVNTIY